MRSKKQKEKAPPDLTYLVHGLPLPKEKQIEILDFIRSSVQEDRAVVSGVMFHHDGRFDLSGIKMSSLQ